MMKKTLLATAVASCLVVPAANAVNISADGTGEVLIYPYYNVNEGNSTFFSVTNTTTVAKAVKVRFREGLASEDVFDFTVYLSPKDVWYASVIRDASDAIRVDIQDGETSCTVPGKAAIEAASFSSQRFEDFYTAGTFADRMSEGHIEIIEMATLPYENLADDIADAVTHSNGVPSDCSVPVTFSGVQGAAIVTDSFQQAGSAADPDNGGSTNSISQRFSAPTGGLYGFAAVFNLSSGVYFPYSAVALDEFAATPIWWPQNGDDFTAIDTNAEGGGTNPTTIQATVANYVTADPSNTTSLNFDYPDLSTPDSLEVSGLNGEASVIGNAVPTTNVFSDEGGPNLVTATFSDAGREVFDKRDAVTAALMARRLQNDFLTSLNFNTDFVVTLPTKHLHVDASFDRNGDGDFTDADDILALAAAPPFTSSENASNGRACETVTLVHYDREERANQGDDGVAVSPGEGTDPTEICFEVSVLSLNDTGGTVSGALGSKAARQATTLQYTDGWMDMVLDDVDSAGNVADTHTLVSTNGVTFHGLPAVGVIAATDVTQGVERGGTVVHHRKVDTD